MRSPIPFPGRFLHRPLCPEGKSVPEDEPCTPCEEQARPFVLAATIVASAMAFIDGSVVSIALPVLQEEFQAGFASLQWVVNAYALLLGGLILIGGAAGDTFGRRRVFIVGIIIFALASWICAVAGSVETLIGGRALQGVGAALLVPQSLAIISASFPKDIRGQAIGLWAGASAVTTAIGPPLGGFLIDFLDWRAAFWMNLPMAAIATGLALRFVPESKATAGSQSSMDWVGGVTAVTAFGSLTVALTLWAEGTLPNVWLWTLICFGLLAFWAFVRTENTAKAPLVPLGLFSNSSFTAANILTFCLYGALTVVLFLLPFDLLERRELSATQAGLTLLPMGLIIGVMSRYAGQVSDRIGAAPLLAAGSTLVTLSAIGFAITLDGYWLGVMGPIFLMASGMAMVVAPLTTVVMNSASDDMAGAASGINNAASRLAGLFGVAAVGALTSMLFSRSLEDASTLADGDYIRFGTLPDAGSALRPALETAFLDAYSGAMWAAAAMCLVSVLLALSMRQPKSAARLT